MHYCVQMGALVVECNQLGIEVGTDLAINLRAHGEWHQYLAKLACLGIFAKMPNAAKHSQLGQVTPSHAKKRVIFLMSLVVCLVTALQFTSRCKIFSQVIIKTFFSNLKIVFMDCVVCQAQSMAGVPTFSGNGDPILSLTGEQCIEYALFWGMVAHHLLYL